MSDQHGYVVAFSYIQRAAGSMALIRTATPSLKARFLTHIPQSVHDRHMHALAVHMLPTHWVPQVGRTPAAAMQRVL
jgi:hypothetical protein